MAWWALIIWFSSLYNLHNKFIIPTNLKDKYNNQDIHNTQSNQYKSQHLPTSKSSNETLMNTWTAGVGHSSICENSNSHSYVASYNGSKTTRGEWNSSVWEVSWSNLYSHFKEVYGGS